MTDRELLEKVLNKLVSLEAGMATKKDLENMATKKDLADMEARLTAKIESSVQDLRTAIDVTQKHIRDHEHMLKLVTK